jgi:hypothetical protein
MRAALRERMMRERMIETGQGDRLVNQADK